MFNNKVILVTGGTGSFGNKFTKMVLENFSPKKLIIFSRDEMKQWEMRKNFEKYANIRFFIGDVRDASRLRRAFSGVDILVHAAATKIVPTAEYDSFECVKTNIIGAMNVIDACIDCNVPNVVALSTDKACSPINLYGATKLTSDKLFVSANAYAGEHGSRFSVVRYGNVMGSRGSVIPYFNKIIQSGGKELPITHRDMTRFMITLEQGVMLVWHAIEDMLGGEIYVRKIPSMNIMQIAEVLAPNTGRKFIGIRPGEKLHEEMISVEDANYTFEYDHYYKILPMLHEWYKDKNRIKNGCLVPKDFSYKSDTNNEWMTNKQLLKWVEENLR